MSEPKLISPMLDSFEMGGPISDHNGVRCCPAMRKNSDDKYIVKIISIPESQTKLDALLLTGAFSDSQAALSYFEELACGIVDEKKILDNLSQLEGFIPFEDCQIVPMDDAVGYDVYLLSEYRKTLERLTAKKAMTQLSAVNLGLDLCAALSACRRSGYLFVDLKPSNIYVTGDNEYKIGDLGFVRLGSLKYESLPDKYRSSYTAPELEDIIAPLNDTIDIYALGLVLYQVFNGGTLPFEGQQAPAVKFDPPQFADDEMAEIILKACDPDPANRWQDPVQMGQAIVAYMQKNGVNDTPLTAENFGTVDNDAEVAGSENDETNLFAEEADIDLIDAIDAIIGESVSVEAAEGVSTEEVNVEFETEEITDVTEDIDESPCDPVAEEIIEVVEEPVCDTAVGDIASDDDITQAADEITDTAEEAIEEEQIDTEIISDVVSADEVAAEEATEAAEETATDIVSDVEEYINLSFLDELETTEQDGEIVDESNISGDIADILDQIDELTAHDVPSPVVAPEPITITIPDPVLTEDDVVINVDDSANESSETADDINAEEDIAVVAEEEMPYVPKKKRTGLIWGIIIAIVLALAAGGYFFYSYYYLQPIHAITLDGSEDSLQVVLNTETDETLLTVVCADSHGNKVSAPVVGGKAAFTGLTADTAYTVSVEIDGFHKLTGTTSKVYSTPVQTKMMQINAITGSESGSVNLSFAVDGPASEKWNVLYNAEGEAERVVEFSGHSVTLNGLTVGKEYTFKLEPVTDIYLSGETEITYVAKDLVCAENLHISSFLDGALIAQWDVPSDTAVTQWTVRCYNDAGYSETISTDTNTVTFENLDESLAYTIEVTAADMSVFQRVSVGANTITLSEFIADTTETGMLSLSWNSNRGVPADGWAVEYSVDGIKVSEPVIVTENVLQLSGVPHGNYIFNVTDTTGSTVLSGSYEYAYADVSDFDAYAITKSNITPRLCKTPDHSDWNYQDLEDEDYVNSFVANDKISVVLACDGKVDESDDEILIAYCVYSEDEILVTYAHTTQRWNSMWNKDYCELDIPVTPKEAGTYNVIIYFNGAEVGSQKFEITA